ncbi:hypothetical protein PLICRDRAFT_181186 [Plicaturopsis crispa FD-325 SS-3]|uniref:Uncharacterized protein n=1 Tax=Plicaturopsis crispa FD-325 SS-3 TaxID=944288 RepID=A0A0C9T3J6_PLICR|nr:hypothetical protein PLICRDRAFT_181186 [Plicaturopsis crispa FD-325 SS-3]
MTPPQRIGTAVHRGPSTSPRRQHPERTTPTHRLFAPRLDAKLIEDNKRRHYGSVRSERRTSAATQLTGGRTAYHVQRNMTAAWASTTGAANGPTDAGGASQPFVITERRSSRNSRPPSPSKVPARDSSSDERNSNRSAESVAAQLQTDPAQQISSYEDLEQYPPLLSKRGENTNVWDEPLHATIYRFFSDEVGSDAIPQEMLRDSSGEIVGKEAQPRLRIFIAAALESQSSA